MMDTSKAWEEAARETRAQVVATQVVVPLRSELSDTPLTAEQRETILLQCLERAEMQLEILGDDIASKELVARLNEHDTRLKRRLFALNMRLGLVHLVGVMGRAP